MTTTNYVKLNDSKFISISGNDRNDFLQGMITNDIFKCESQKPLYSCLLTPQGKFVADFFIVNLEKNYLIEIHKKFYKDFLNKIKIYKLRSKIILEEKNNILSLVILNNKNFLNLNNNIISFDDPRNNKLGTKIFIEKKDLEFFFKKN